MVNYVATKRKYKGKRVYKNQRTGKFYLKKFNRNTKKYNYVLLPKGKKGGSSQSLSSDLENLVEDLEREMKQSKSSSDSDPFKVYLELQKEYERKQAEKAHKEVAKKAAMKAAKKRLGIREDRKKIIKVLSEEAPPVYIWPERFITQIDRLPSNVRIVGNIPFMMISRYIVRNYKNTICQHIPEIYIDSGISDRNRLTKTTVTATGNKLGYINQCKKRFVVIRLSLFGTHANLLIYDTQNKTVERFEPHGATERDYGIYSPYIDDAIAELLIDSNIDIKDGGYLLPEFICPYAGPQVRGKKVDTDPIGYCQYWVMYYLDLRVTYPDVPPELLLKDILKVHNMSEHGSISFIRGYVHFYSKLYEHIIRDLTDKKLVIGDTYIHGDLPAIIGVIEHHVKKFLPSPKKPEARFRWERSSGSSEKRPAKRRKK